jgi:hypothetical protein
MEAKVTSRKMVRIGGAIILFALILLLTTSVFPLNGNTQGNDSNTSIPLTDMGDRTYLGFEGGLYPGGINEMPEAHRLEGLARASNIQPLDTGGKPDPNGKTILLSIGLSNTTQEFCNRGQQEIFQCNPWTLMGRAEQSPQVDHEHLMIVNGAKSGQVAEEWVSPDSPNYKRILQDHLLPQGLSEGQVQIIWLKLANSDPTTSLPAPDADAYLLLAQLGDVLRALHSNYPDLKMVFISSRIYGGYGDGINPEPFAYETGFAVKWLIEAQINQMRDGIVDPKTGDLNYTTVAPWIAWGPYLWANGSTPRNDGLKWELQDFRQDGIHPSRTGEEMVGELLFQFFITSPFTQDWFLTTSR